jgi:hypothetical protein
MKTLFNVPDELTYKNGIKITININLEKELNLIFEEEYIRLSSRCHKTSDLEIISNSKKFILDSLCHQISLITLSGNFDLNTKEIILSQNNVIKDKKVHFQKEAMLQESVLLEKLDETFNNNILRLLRTASICSILSL